MAERTSLPAVDGWFTIPANDAPDGPTLIGARCVDCRTYVFPPRSTGCPNPSCASDDLASVPLSRRGTVWSYVENRYPPPPPYQAAEPFVPYALAAVELDAEGLVILGQVVDGVLAADLTVGMEMELVLQTLFSEIAESGESIDRVVYAWAPASASDGGRS